MRDIIFRGKAVGVGVWMFGSYVQTTEALTDRPVSLICPERGNMSPGGNFPAVEVDPSTVGQYTGLTDRNGQRVFEGDIVHDDFNNTDGVVYFGDYASPMNNAPFTHNIGFYVEWIKGTTKDFARKDLGFWFIEVPEYLKVVGNIHDDTSASTPPPISP